MNTPTYTEFEIYSFYDKYMNNEHTIFTEKFDRFFSYIDHEDINSKFFIFLFFFKNDNKTCYSCLIDHSLIFERFLRELINDDDINKIYDIFYDGTLNDINYCTIYDANKDSINSMIKEISDNVILKNKFNFIYFLYQKFNFILCNFEDTSSIPKYSFLYIKFINKFLKINHDELKKRDENKKKLDIILESRDKYTVDKIKDIFMYPIESNTKNANKITN